MRKNLCNQTENGSEYVFVIVKTNQGIWGGLKYCILTIKSGEWIGIGMTVSPDTKINIPYSHNPACITPIPKCDEIPLIALEDSEIKDELVIIKSKIEPLNSVRF